MDYYEIRAELRDLSRRLTRVEEHLHLEARRTDETPVIAEPPAAVVAPPCPPALTVVPPVASPVEPLHGHEDRAVIATLLSPPAAPAPAPPITPPPVPPTERPRTEPAVSVKKPAVRHRPEDLPEPAPVFADDERADAASPTRSLEVLIGERWMAWVGAIVVVVAMGFFVKLAYDLGWWGRLAPLTKCLMAAGVGAALITGGEIALRRVGRIAAVSLYSAGLGTLYLTAYATFRFFHLLPQIGAFWLMLVVAVLGVGITLRGRMLSIGVLSLLGGYMSPILLAEQITFAAALPLYISALLAIALGLSAYLPQPFRMLRYVGLALHVAVASQWVYHEGASHWLIAVFSLTLWWAMVVGEALWAALRGQSTRGNPIITLLFTFWYASVGCGVLAVAQPAARNWLGVFTGAVAAACALIALLAGPGVAVLRIRPRRAIELMGVTLWAQTGILIATAIGLQFRDSGESFGMSIGWLAMAVACVEIGRRLPSRGVDAFGLIVGMLGLAHVWALDSRLVSLWPAVWVCGDVTLSRWGLLALGAVLATLAIARRLRTQGGVGWLRVCAFITFAGVVQWIALCAASCHNLALTAGWLLGAGVLLVLSRVGQSPGYRRCAWLVLLLATAKWLGVDALLTRISGSWAAANALPVGNWQFAVALLICACIYALFHTHPKAPRPVRLGPDDEPPPSPTRTAPRPGQWILIGGVLFLLTALCFEVDRAIGRYELTRPAGTQPLMPLNQCRILWCGLLWACGGLASALAGRHAKLNQIAVCGRALVWLAGFVWLINGALQWRVEHGIGTFLPFVNVQFGVGLALAGIFYALFVMLRPDRTEPNAKSSQRAEVTLLGGIILLLLAISLELDRWIGGAAQTLCAAGSAEWLAWQARWLWWAALWAVGGLVTLIYGRRGRYALIAEMGYCGVIAAGLAWGTFGTLFWRARYGVGTSPAFINVQFTVGLTLAAFFYLLFVMLRRDPAKPNAKPSYRVEATLLGGVILLLLAFSLEFDRWLGGTAPAQVARGAALWPAWQARWLWWAVLWGAGGLGTLIYGRRRQYGLLAEAGYGGLAAAGVAWLTLGTLLWRCTHGVVLAPVVLNLQAIVGAALIGLLAVGMRETRDLGRGAPGASPLLQKASVVCFGLILAMGLWLGSLELDRLFAPEAQRVANPAMVRQTAWSIYWGVYAIGLIALGFWRWAPPVRYAGLALLALTLGKVLIIDLEHVRYVYRVLSLLAVGLFFIGTSITYARLASRLRERPTDGGQPRGAGYDVAGTLDRPGSAGVRRLADRK